MLATSFCTCQKSIRLCTTFAIFRKMVGSSRWILYTYSRVFPGPTFYFLQTLVTVTLVVDTVSIVGEYICVYLVSVRILYWTTQDCITI
jgi:hypothetical protein